MGLVLGWGSVGRCWLCRSQRGVQVGVCVGIRSVGALCVVGLGHYVLRLVLGLNIGHPLVV